jgi:DNA-binding GntR family transcriptional regulator
VPTSEPHAHREPRLSARDRTLATLRRRIISLELKPGTPLSENELAQELGVSRTPVRESLILLREEGLVQVFPQIGSLVSRVDLARVTQAQFVREAIECASLSEVTASVTPLDTAELRENLKEQRKALAEENLDDFFRLDEDFHYGLLRLASHESAWATVTSAKAHLDRARRMSLFETRSVSDLIEQHTDVVDAIEKRDGAAAVGALRTHLRGVFEDIERIQAASPQLFAPRGEPRPVRRTASKEFLERGLQ